MEMNSFLQYFEYQGLFWETFSLKYIKVNMTRKTILSAFHCFLFYENIVFTSEVIALLVTAYSH